MNVFVAILLGSESDLEVMRGAAKTFKEFDVSFEMRVLSAHRTPEDVRLYMADAEQRGCRVYIAAAGMAAHLAGAVAAHTTRPVIGVPIKSSLSGLDALLSTVQMPSGIPVATVAIDGARNAATLAAQMLAITDDALDERITQQRVARAKKIKEIEIKV